MSSMRFEFLDLSGIEDEDLKLLESILDDKKVEFSSPTSDASLLEELEEVGEDLENLDIGEEDDDDDGDFILSSKSSKNASGMSFFVDGGTAEDIDLGKPPPMLCPEESPLPPEEDSPSTPCEEQEEVPPPPPEEPINMYPLHPQHPPYLSQPPPPPPPMVPPMNVHSVATSGPIYNLAPPYPPHTTPGTVPNGMYPHIPPNHPHASHLVHIENCHVNLSNFGNNQPHAGMYTTPPSHYQGPSPQHQVFSPSYMMPDQSMSMQMKSNMDKDYDHKRHDASNRGHYRGRGGRGRGTRRRGRDDHERSNSVSSDHSSYSDSGGKPHYKEPVASIPIPANPYPHLIPYHYPIQYQVNQLTRPQGYIIPHQFMPDHYVNQPGPVLAYPPHPPASMALMSHENTNHLTPHSECDTSSLPNSDNTVQEHITVEQQQVTSITTHSDYIVTSVTSHQEDSCQYSYSNIDDTSIMPDATPSVSVAFNDGLTNSTPISSTCIPCKEENLDKKPVVERDTKVLESIEIVSSKIEVREEKISESLPTQKENAKVVSSDREDALDEDFPNLVSQNNLADEIHEKSMKASSSLQNEKGAVTDGTLSKGRGKTSPKAQENAKKPPVSKTGKNSGTAPSRDASPSTVSDVVSPVPSNTQRNKESATLPKSSKRRNSPHNKDGSSPSRSSSSPIQFGTQDSITVYNKSVIIIPSKEFKSTTQQLTKPKPKVEGNISTSVSGSTPDDVKSDKKCCPVSHTEESSIPEVSAEEVKPAMDVKLTAESNSPDSQKQSEAAWGQKKIWSQLFKPNEDFANKQVAFVSPFNAKETTEDSDPSKLTAVKENGDAASRDGDADKAKLGGLLKKYNADYRPVLLQPRGLINKNYWCYVNAPLQALLACPSLYQLAKTLSSEAGYASGNASTPFINSIVDFVSEFSTMSPPAKPSRKGGVQKKEPEVACGSPFEPTCVYKMLTNCKENQFTEGRQQDAEEMLSCVLNGLHDEMVESLKLAGGSTPSQNGVGNGDKSTSDQDLSEDETEWKVQGPKKKSCITRTAHFHPSPISQIFWGQLRSVLQQAGGSTTANLQPFNTLPLDIQSPKVDTLKDALSQLVTREEITGFTCSKTNQEVTASNQVMFEDLPRVLILQLKRFIYDKDGGLQKVTKRLQFPIDLEITKDLISTNNRGRFSASQRKYKLFAIVNHEGKEATKGHYVADVHHSGYGCWVRYDDSNVKAIPEGVVLRHEPPRVPYLLFYRRSDTLTSPPGNSNKNNK